AAPARRRAGGDAARAPGLRHDELAGRGGRAGRGPGRGGRSTGRRAPLRPPFASGVMRMRVQFTVEETEAGRLDRVLADRFPGVGRRRWAEILAAGEVRVDGRRARKGDQVLPGARIEIAGQPAV